jgi:hypothetical protein
MRSTTIEFTQEVIEEQYYQLEEFYKLLQFSRKTISTADSLDKFPKTNVIDFILEYHCYAITSSLDLLVIYKGLIHAKSRWEEIFFSKKAYLVIYESIVTYHKNQKKMHGLVKTKFNDLMPQLSALNLNLKRYKKLYFYDSKISQVRNQTAAHYSNDFFIYYPIVEELRQNEAVDAIEGYLILIFEMKQIVTELFLKHKK